MQSILIIGLIQCIIFLILNLQKSKKVVADKVLLLWLSIFGLHLLLLLFEELNLVSLPIIILAKTIVLLHGPILFVYALKVFHDDSQSKLGLHFVPFVLMSIAGLLTFENHFILWQDVLLVIKTISILSYPVVTIFWLRNRNIKLRSDNSNNIVLEIDWIKNLAYLLFYSFATSVLFITVNQFFQWELNNNLDIIIYVIMITIMGYYGLKLGIVFTSRMQEEDESNKSTESYKFSPLNEEKILKIEEDIRTFFLETEGYLNANFSITQLSQMLNIPKHHLSQVINGQMKTTFYDIVNTNRVEYVKNQLLAGEDSKFTLEALGYEAGFNTKAAFYFHFKKTTGKTPGQFKKQIRID